jgi:hypothetical protein
VPAASPRGRRFAAWSPWLRRIAAVGVGAVLVAPFVAVVVDLAGVDYRAGLDYAWIHLRVDDVGGDQHPLVGPYSRIGANHPGPMLFYLLAAPYRLLGASAGALLSATAILNGCAIAGVAAVAYRRGRLALLLLSAALTSVLVLALGAPFLRDPWNPWTAVLSFLLFLLLVWSVSVGDLPLLPAAAFVGSFLVQTHLGYAVLVAYLGLWALSGLTLSVGREWRVSSLDERTVIRRRLIRWVAIAFAVAGLCWLAPIVDQTTGDPGNLTALFESLEENDNPAIGFEPAGGYLARELGALGPWMGADGEADGVGEVHPAGLWHLLVPAAAFVAAAVAAWRVRARDALFLQATVAVAVAAGYLATAMIDGTVHTYLIRWAWPIALAIWLSVGWSTYRALGDRARRPVQLIGAPVLVAVLALASYSTVVDDPGSLPGEGWSEQIQAIEPEVVAELEALGTEGPVFVFAGDSNLDSYAVTVGLQVALATNGFEITDPAGDPSRYGTDRTDRETKSTVNVLVVSNESIALLRHSPDLQFVTSWNPRSPDLQGEVERLERLEARKALDDEERRRLAGLRARGTRIGVYLDTTPPG